VLWGEIVDGLLAIVLDLTSSLSKILRVAVKSAAVLFILYRRHRTKLMPSQLYHDTQCIFNDILICVAKMQVALDDGTLDDHDFYSFQPGSDRQEQQFSGVRTLTHQRNVDMIMLAQRLSAQTQMDAVFEEHPDWNRGSRRLGTAVDHVNTKSTTGCHDVRLVDR
jgi:hypothetical protein